MLLAVSILVLFPLSILGSTHYVKPNASSPGESCTSVTECLTLNQYVLNSSSYFTAGATFVFLPGNHSLTISLNITAVSNLSLTVVESEFRATIVSTHAITACNVTSLDVAGIIFIFKLPTEGTPLSALHFINSDQVVIDNSVFQKRSLPHNTFLSTESNIIIKNSLFEGNVGLDGGAVRALQDTILTLVGNSFTSNHAFSGGAIYAEESTLSLRDNDFSHNSFTTDGGGAIYCKGCTLVLIDNNTFHENFVTEHVYTVYGGAIEMKGGKMIATGTAVFSNNIASIGGAISMLDTRAEFGEGNFIFESNMAKDRGGGLYFANSSPFSTDNNHDALFTAGKGIFTFTAGMATSEVCGINTRDSTENRIESVNLFFNSGTSGGLKEQLVLLSLV